MSRFRFPHGPFDFDVTGRRIAPTAKPSGPLITLLESLWPRERVRITAVGVGHPLGYIGHRQFHNAEQAYRWLVPYVMPHSLPSQTAQDKRFHRVLTIDDLAAHARVPDAVVEAWWQRHGHLRRLGSQRPAVT